MKNNIFNFATSELSQDAFICWCANAFNGDMSELKNMSVDFIHMLTQTNDEINSVEVVRQYSKKVKVDKDILNLKIDVLLVVNGDTAVIIEDKTYSDLHDSQISRYRRGLEALAKDGELSLPIEKERFYFEDKKFNINNIICVFLKTGEYYPKDEENEELKDVICIHREEMLTLLKPYINCSEIVSQYYESILELDKWYRNVEKEYYDEKYDEALSHAYGQLVCAKDLFHGNMIGTDLSRKILIETGSSYGRPYTWIWIYGSTGSFWFGYRIDKRTDKEGKERFCISFKQYFNYKKLDKDGRYLESKIDMFNFFKKYFETVRPVLKINKFEIGGNNGSYNESTIASFYFDDYSLEELRENLQTIGEDAVRIWNFYEERHEFPNGIHEYTDESIAALSNMYLENNPSPVNLDDREYWTRLVSIF